MTSDQEDTPQQVEEPENEREKDAHQAHLLKQFNILQALFRRPAGVVTNRGVEVEAHEEALKPPADPRLQVPKVLGVFCIWEEHHERLDDVEENQKAPHSDVVHVIHVLHVPRFLDPC